MFKLFSYKKYNISIWQHPPFIFLILGLLIMGALILTYFVGSRFLEVEYLALVIIILSIILLSLNYIIVNSFQHLADANLMKTEFMNIVSHQLKTPLTNLKWTTELAINERKKGRNVGQFLYIIREQNGRMLKLINNMLIAARIEQGRWIVQKEKLDLLEIAKKTIQRLAPTIEENNIKIALKADKDIPPVFTDRMQINHVIENLIDNAICYSEEKGEVEVIVRKLKKKNIRFIVKDKGVGIPKEEQKKIFQKFYRSTNVLQYQTQGLGLSLFIVRLIIEKLNGKVGFKSKEEEGSTFWFDLPIK
jgi:signal transduction histidine kinase